MTEVWKDIEGYESYQVSDLGRIKSLNYGRTGEERILKPVLRQNGYLFVILCKDGKRKDFSIHRLVSEAFLPNPHNYPQVNHKNEIKTDNRLENLEWCTCSYNNNYGTHIARAALKKSIPVAQYDKNGNFLKEWESSTQVERELGIWQTSIIQCCKGKYKTSGGYIWKYKKSED